jgi:Zinc carboxypeptidase/Chitobiase/beta-hexosaminidase C-terminal domain
MMKGSRATGLRLFVFAACAVVFTFVMTTGVAAAEERGIDPNQGDSLVEVVVPNKDAARRLQERAESFGVEFNEHYLRHNASGNYTVTVFANEAELDALADAGYEIGPTIEGPATYSARMAEYRQGIREEERAVAAALGDPVTDASHEGELIVLRVDYFEHYAGRFLSVEVKTRLARVQADGTGIDPSTPTLALSWNRGGTTPIDTPGGDPRIMDINLDTDTTPDTYIEHRELVRIGFPGESDPPRPTRVRIGSSTGAFVEAPVNVWLGGGVPPFATGFQQGFVTNYPMDPTQVYDRFDQLARDFPNISNMIPLPYRTNGYQRRAQVTMGTYVATTLGAPAPAGATAVRLASTANLTQGSRIAIGVGTPNHEVRTIASFVSPTPPSPTPQVNLLEPLSNAHASGEAVQGEPGAGSNLSAAAAAAAVVLTSRAFGHEGGNDISAEFRNPGAANSPLAVSLVGDDLTVDLRTDSTGAIASTATEVIDAINAHPGASVLLKATPYRNSPANGVVSARWRINLSDFLTTATNAHVVRGPRQYSVMRIGKVRDGSKVGVFLYCQQHAREWATPLTCLETAERLLKNYGTDPLTTELVDNLDIFILPVSNPDGSHYSIHNFTQQRRNMTNWCVEGSEETDNPMLPNFWAPRTNPQTGTPYANNDPSSRNLWGVDLNRNNTFATHWDGYIGASASCTSDVFAGPGAFAPGVEPKPGEASEPEIRNELWIADTFPHIKFSNNIHSFGGYFMWAPGAYLPNRDEGEAVHPNIGIEEYFWQAGDRILQRIKQYRGTAILPERTGPIADVLYSAGGNSADEHWYKRGVIAYSFETGADLFLDPATTLAAASTPGATGVRLANRNGFQPGDRIAIDTGVNQEVRIVTSVAATNPTAPAPNVTLSAPLSSAHASGVPVSGGTGQQGVGFQPPQAEGLAEAMEFAHGNYGLLESAIAYARDTAAPQVTMTGARASRTPIDTTFQWNEPAVIRYTTDGSTPTASSPEWDRTGAREPGEVFHISTTTTFRWLATDVKGNQSTGSARFSIDTTAPTTTATVVASPSGGFSTVTLTADDQFAAGGSGVARTEYRVDGGAFQTYSGPFSVLGAGAHTVDFRSIDEAGNTEATKSVSFTTPAAAAAVACNVRLQPGSFRAGQRTLARATVTLSGGSYEGARVTFRGPGVNRTVATNASGVASVRVRPSRRGTLRAAVVRDTHTLGCSTSKPVRPRATRRGVAGAGTSGGGTGGAGLTGRRP